MVCENKTSWWNYFSWLSDYFDADLKGGECRFDTCNMTTFADMLESGGSTSPRAFMIGHGPSFASASSAFLYCNYSLQLAVKWAKSASPYGTPQIQTPSRAACWLERNVLPVYIYYSEGKNINSRWMGNLSKSLNDNDAYPSLLVSEINFNSSNDSQVAAVIDQIVAIKSNCPKCLAVLGVRSGDKEGVAKILSDPTVRLNGKNMSELVDIVGFGFLANDYPYCNPTRIIASNLAFSRFILMNFSKPSIWLYVGASIGNNTDGSCYFSNQTVHNFYQKLFAVTPGLVSSGVIGMSFYEFTDRTGPLPCKEGQGCDYGLINLDGQQKHPELNTWSRLCQFIATDRYRNPIVFSRNGRGFVCDAFQNWNIFNQVSEEINTEAGLSTDEVIPAQKIKHLTCGEVCISQAENRQPDIYGSAGKSFDSSHCTLYPQIEEFSDDADISSTYFRAIVEQESGFNPKAVSCVDLSNRNCNYNPDGSYMNVSQICEAAGVPPQDCPPECPAGKKPCGLGLSQCIDLPGTVPECGGQKYNPFNPSMSICCGTTKFKKYLSEAITFINNHWSGLANGCPGSLNVSDKTWAAYYLASNLYYGLKNSTSETTFQNFMAQRGNGCSGEQNYIRYIQSINPSPDYGAQVMSRYFSAADKCDSDCPGK
jgi:hypothetical protein